MSFPAPNFTASSSTSERYAPNLKKKIFCAVLFQSAWFCCVLLPLPWAIAALGIFLAVHMLWIMPVPYAWGWVVRIAVIGCAMDSILVHSGVMVVEGSNTIPFWLVCMWIMFSFVAVTALTFLIKKPFLTAFLSFFGASTTYFAGAKLAPAASLGGNTLISGAIIGVCWVIFLLLVFALLDRDDRFSEKVYVPFK